MKGYYEDLCVLKAAENKANSKPILGRLGRKLVDIGGLW